MLGFFRNTLLIIITLYLQTLFLQLFRMKQIHGFGARAVQVLACCGTVTVSPQCHPVIPAGANKGWKVEVSNKELETYCRY